MYSNISQIGAKREGSTWTFATLAREIAGLIFQTEHWQKPPSIVSIYLADRYLPQIQELKKRFTGQQAAYIRSWEQKAIDHLKGIVD